MYSPKISENQVRRLYRLKQKIGKPMAKMVREAVEAYLRKQEAQDEKKSKGRNE